VFKSLSKLKTDQIFGGVLLNQKVSPALLEREEDKLKLEMLVRTFFDVLHGWHVQYNVVSRETLLDAQKHPEKHQDLIVRVAGYSAFFNIGERRAHSHKFYIKSRAHRLKKQLLPVCREQALSLSVFFRAKL
jgi:pyruvate-formate lyase